MTGCFDRSWQINLSSEEEEEEEEAEAGTKKMRLIFTRSIGSSVSSQITAL